MTDSAFSIRELRTLADMACNGVLTDRDATQLEQLLHGNDDAQQLYLTRVSLDTWLRWETGDQAQEPTPPNSTSPAIGFLSTTFHNTIGYFSEGMPQGYLIGAVITALGLWICAHIYVSHPEQVVEISQRSAPTVIEPKMELVGKITGMVDVKWSDPNTETLHGANVLLGRKYALASGLMEITYDTGAKVILQGPVTYEVESNGGYLAVGKLTGKLEKKAERNSVSSNPQSIISNPFVIRTPTATVTDLGTEFGIEVNEQGTMTSHVFRGSIKLQAAFASGEAEATARVLHENQSARVESSSGNPSGGNPVIVLGPSAKPANFVRELVRPTIKTLDLVDVVAGGNGFGAARNRGIDPLTGRQTHDYRGESPTAPARIPDGKGFNQRVERMPFVDRVFIHDSRKTYMLLNSAGQAFYDFSITTNCASGCIWAGSFIPNDLESRTKLYGIDYASSGHGLLSMHANQGITFDLDAIRRANPGYKFVRFRATAANPETMAPQGKTVWADMWVFIDGHVHVSLRQMSARDGAKPVNISLRKTDRFLTLATTDGDNSTFCHYWTMFGDPRLELEKTSVVENANGATAKMQ